MGIGRRLTGIFGVIALAGLLAGTADAVLIDWVTVGNPGNTGELSGAGAGGSGPDAIVGSVGYTYRISKYEVTAGQYAEFLNAVADTDTYGLYNNSMWTDSWGCKIEQSGSSGSYAYSVAGDYANRPVNYVSWYDTLRFCNWLNNGQPTGLQNATTTEDGAYDMSLGASVVRRSGAQVFLPTENEWYKAAYHKNDGVTGNYWDYPTSSNSAPGRDMTEATNAGNNANYDGSPRPIDSPYYTTVAGEFQLSDSPYGTFDQGGNVWEWNEALVSGSSRGLRGGGFTNPTGILQASCRYSFDPSQEFGDFGIRVASEWLNQNPTVTATLNGFSSDVTVNEGSTVTVAGSISDLDSGQPLSLYRNGLLKASGSSPGPVSHSEGIAYIDEGLFSCTWTGNDGELAATPVTRNVTVLNVAPTIASLTGDLMVTAGNSFSFGASATNTGINDLLTYSWDLNGDLIYGDILGASGNWIYNLPGLYTVGLQVSDGDGGLTYDSFQVSVLASGTPEPATLALVALGALALIIRRK